MAKYKVKQGCQLLYPDGSVRGERGYIIDGKAEPETVAGQASVLQHASGRQAVVSPVDMTRLVAQKTVAEKPKKKTAKKKTTKKKT